MKTPNDKITQYRMLIVLITSFLVFIGILDYRAWTRLGPGGIEHSLLGWGKVTIIRLITLGSDPLNSERIDPFVGKGSDHSFLENLSTRDGPRPHIASHPVPHRQLNQIPDTNTLLRIKNICEEPVLKNKTLLEHRVSQYEKHNPAIWLRTPNTGNPEALNNGEIAHCHPSDGSIHVVLSPSDSKQVIDKNWGELHSLSGGRFIPAPTYILLYAPRNDSELEVAQRIIAAAIQYAAAPPDQSTLASYDRTYRMRYE